MCCKHYPKFLAISATLWTSGTHTQGFQGICTVHPFVSPNYALGIFGGCHSGDSQNLVRVGSVCHSLGALLNLTFVPAKFKAI